MNNNIHILTNNDRYIIIHISQYEKIIKYLHDNKINNYHLETTTEQNKNFMLFRDFCPLNCKNDIDELINFASYKIGYSDLSY